MSDVVNSCITGHFRIFFRLTIYKLKFCFRWESLNQRSQLELNHHRQGKFLTDNFEIEKIDRGEQCTYENYYCRKNYLQMRTKFAWQCKSIRKLLKTFKNF